MLAAGRLLFVEGEVLTVTAGLAIPLSELTWRFSTSGGPGGQHVNTSQTRAEVIFDVAGSPSLTDAQRARLLDRLGPEVRVAASDERSQTANRRLALARLGERLATGLAVPPRRHATRPTRASQRRRLEAKRRQSDQKRQRRSGGAWD
jgi:ribosome-associated protein